MKIATTKGVKIIGLISVEDICFTTAVCFLKGKGNINQLVVWKVYKEEILQI